MNTQEKYISHGSLFSGIGGFDLAAEWIGWKNVFHCEINEFCAKILNYHFPNAEHYADITKTDFTKWRGKIDVLSGGFPCQPFSVAGNRKGTDDNRYLCPEMLRAIQEIRPTWIVGENVAGILSMVQPGKEVEMGCQDSIFGENNRKRVLLRQEYIIESVKILNERDIPSNRLLFRLVPSERHTGETGYGLLPTVQTQGLKVCRKQGETIFMPLNLLPTPTARDWRGAPTLEYFERKGKNPMQATLPDFFARHGRSSQLNPLFVEEMMGFPENWTASPFLNGEKKV